MKIFPSYDDERMMRFIYVGDASLKIQPDHYQRLKVIKMLMLLSKKILQSGLFPFASHISQEEEEVELTWRQI